MRTQKLAVIAALLLVSLSAQIALAQDDGDDFSDEIDVPQTMVDIVTQIADSHCTCPDDLGHISVYAHCLNKQKSAANKALNAALRYLSIRKSQFRNDVSTAMEDLLQACQDSFDPPDDGSDDDGGDDSGVGDDDSDTFE